MTATGRPSLLLPLRPYLRDVGYRKRDVVGVYALNLALVPINLAGVAKSIHQAITGEKGPFARTPKVSGRTRVPAGYIAAELFILAYRAMGATFDLTAGRWWHGVFGVANIALLAYAVVFFIGLREAAADLAAPLERLRRARRHLSMS